MYGMNQGAYYPKATPGSSPRGLWGRWLQLTCPPGNPDDGALPLARRELLRRAQLASAIIAGLLFIDLLLIPATLDQLSSLLAVLVVGLACVAAIFLNRAGQVTAAGYILVLVLVAAIAEVFIGAPDGVVSVDYFPVYDLLTVPLLVAASVLPRVQVFFIAGLNIAFILADVVLQPHGALTLNTPDGYSLVAKPIILQIILAVVSYLWARSMGRAIARADRAEELAALEHAVAEQRRQLEVGAQQILETHVRVANGDFAARAPVLQDNILWQVAASLNNLLARLQKSGQSEHQLRRTEDELRRLAGAIDDAQAGRRPIWPAVTGTAADLIIERITGRSRQAQPATGLMSPPQQLPPQGPAHFPAQQPITQAHVPPQMPPSVPSMHGQIPGGAPFGPGWVNSGSLPPVPPAPPQQPNSQHSQHSQQGQEPAEPDNPWFVPPESQNPNW